jgi:hypothetical protein
MAEGVAVIVGEYGGCIREDDPEVIEETVGEMIEEVIEEMIEEMIGETIEETIEEIIEEAVAKVVGEQFSTAAGYAKREKGPSASTVSQISQRHPDDHSRRMSGRHPDEHVRTAVNALGGRVAASTRLIRRLF